MRLRIGTRRSRLALAQAQEVASLLQGLGVEADLVPMVTSGDRGAPQTPSAHGVKGLFVAEIVGALQAGRVDVAVHSAKDLPSDDPDGVIVGAVPERGDAFDVLVTREAALEPGATVGTSSLRRQAQLRRSHPELTVRPLRGNVDTRLAKLEAAEVDGLVLAAAGLARLGLSPAHAAPLAVEEMVPAPGQGALAVQVRNEDAAARKMVKQLDQPPSRVAFETERALVRLLGGGCSLPLGAYARTGSPAPNGGEDVIRLVAVVIRPDGSALVRAESQGSTPDSVASDVAETLLRGGAGDILAESGAAGQTSEA